MDGILLPALLGTCGLACLAMPLLLGRLAAAQVARRLEAACSGDWGARSRRWTSPGALRTLLVRIGAPLLRDAARTAALAAELRAAAIWQADAPAAFAGGRLLLILACAGLGALAAEGGAEALRNAALGAILGHVAANRALAAVGRRRSRRLRAELPSAIDLIALAFEGGAGIEQALRAAGGQAVHPAPAVQQVLRLFAADIDRGTPYELAIVRLGDRLGIEEAQLLTGLLRQALQHGTELVAPLKALGRELRERRVADARAAIGRATTLMTVVMVTCLLPALLILIGAPSVGAILDVLGKFSR